MQSTSATSAIGPDKAADAEVAEEDGYPDGELEVSVGLRIAPGEVDVAADLEGGDTSGQGEKAEEDARELKPKDAGEFGDGPPNRFAEATASPSDTSGGGPDLCGGAGDFMTGALGRGKRGGGNDLGLGRLRGR